MKRWRSLDRMRKFRKKSNARACSEGAMARVTVLCESSVTSQSHIFRPTDDRRNQRPRQKDHKDQSTIDDADPHQRRATLHALYYSFEDLWWLSIFFLKQWDEVDLQLFWIGIICSCGLSESQPSFLSSIRVSSLFFLANETEFRCIKQQLCMWRHHGSASQY